MAEASRDPSRGLYTISVAAELAGTAPQSLRAYEERGLVTPSRTGGGTRLYSDDDITRLRRAVELTSQGVNLAGVARILDLEDENTRLRAEPPDGGEGAPVASRDADEVTENSSSIPGGEDGVPR